jgi:hypothetical protein
MAADAAAHAFADQHDWSTVRLSGSCQRRPMRFDEPGQRIRTLPPFRQVRVIERMNFTHRAE